MERHYLNVKYSEKDEVKALGAKWDAPRYKWYYEGEENPLFDRWKPQPKEQKQPKAGKAALPLREEGSGKYAVLGLGDFVILDTETTGFYKDDEVVELGIVSREGETLYDEVFRPFKRMGKDAMEVTHITNEMLRNGRSFKDEWERIMEAIDGRTVIAHNGTFDKRLIKQTLEKHGLDGSDADFVFDKYIDSMNIAKRFMEAENYKLETLSNLTGIVIEQTHRATDDCYMVLKVLDYLKDKEEAVKGKQYSFFDMGR